jgi:peptidoglycan hydrolase-like protein with peptidoglycan-binding domain
MRHLKPSTILLILALALVMVIGTACGSTEGAVGPQGPQGEKGEQGEPGPAGPSMVVAMAQVNADASMGQRYNVDSVTWDSVGRRYVIKLTGINYTHNTYVTIVTAGYSNFTATYAAESGNLVVALTNTSATRQQDHFSFMVLQAP